MIIRAILYSCIPVCLYACILTCDLRLSSVTRAVCESRGEEPRGGAPGDGASDARGAAGGGAEPQGGEAQEGQGAHVPGERPGARPPDGGVHCIALCFCSVVDTRLALCLLLMLTHLEHWSSGSLRNCACDACLLSCFDCATCASIVLRCVASSMFATASISTLYCCSSVAGAQEKLDKEEGRKTKGMKVKAMKVKG